MGATDFGYRLARQFGLQVLATRPGLVPFTITGVIHELAARLSGLAIPAEVSIAGGSARFHDSLLFTHRGLSGPAILQLSSYWEPGQEVHINLLPGVNAQQMLLQAKQDQPGVVLRNILAAELPRALVSELQALWWPEHRDNRTAEMPDKLLRQIGGRLNRWTIKPAATEGYRTAEVTLGGIDTQELSSQTMQSKRVPGLFCIGEVVDVTGQLGGFNFQWAWASAQAAGQAI
jgi:predicted Rossmann fold flavoprotein